MLASRRGDTELSHPWSLGKLETTTYPRKSSPSPRMSNTGFETPLSNATEWTGQYSFLPPAEPIFAAQYDGADPVSAASGGGGGGSTGSGLNNTSAATANNTSNSSNGTGQTQTRPSTSTNGDGSSAKDASASPLGLHHRRSIDPLGLRQSSHSQHTGSSQTHMGSGGLGKTPSTPTSDQHGHQQHGHQQHHHQQHHHLDDSHDDSSLLSNSLSHSLSHSLSNPLSAVLQIQDMTTGHLGGARQSSNGTAHGEDHSGLKEDDEDLIDDEDMGDAGEAEGIPPVAQTAAERTAQRRKMKRFRLTHQQTRFLMSEFAKQPHPDAAHRERLSREIPGLSPRQVQVWFQNRRAKIKRLAADDRERMIKMRAVPDDFDNVQALHSPYGAVHGLGTPMASPVDFSAAAAASSPYGDHMMRPLMVDVRRSDTDDHLSPTGLSPAFGNIGFNPSGTMNNSDILSPLSPTSNSDHHRYSSYSSHLSSAGSASSAATAGTIGGPRSSFYAPRQSGSSLDSNNGNSGNNSNNSSSSSSLHHHHHQRHHIRPLQPLQLREAMSRSRSDNLQSPLRSSMSWKGDSLDYSSYHNGNGSPQLGGRPQQSLYPSDSTSSSMGGYDSSAYSGSTVQSPTHMAYTGFPSPGLQASNPSRSSRLRAASATLPLALDLRTSGAAGGGGLGGTGGSPTNASHSFRGSGGSAMSRPSASHHIGSLSGLVSSSSYSTIFSTSAPLTAPLDFGMSRVGGSYGGMGYRTTSSSTGGGIGSGTSDYMQSQISAPLAPSNDFTQAFHASLGGGGGIAGTSSSAASPSSVMSTSISAALNTNSSTNTATSNHNHSTTTQSDMRASSYQYEPSFHSGQQQQHHSSMGDNSDGSGDVASDNDLRRKHSFITSSSNTSAPSMYGTGA